MQKIERTAEAQQAASLPRITVRSALLMLPCLTALVADKSRAAKPSATNRPPDGA